MAAEFASKPRKSQCRESKYQKWGLVWGFWLDNLLKPWVKNLILEKIVSVWENEN